ncbi:hypothetical protein A9Q81_15735 [Gammaproteobacteria bacterium 42_54_T18]|nr:hypothetical protein A9Q81_15735 [Gammaproteobacteria bacterium 42_54_T18]
MKLYQKLCAAVLLTCSSLANAGVITTTGTIDAHSDVDYFSFTMDSASSLEINVLAYGYNGTYLDPYIYLYQPDVNGLFVAANDDSLNGNWSADGSTSSLDSYLSLNLAAGDYTLAIGDFYLSDADARDGFNNSFGSSAVGDYQITFTGTGLATSVSEPGSIALFGLGLVGLGFARRRQS